MRLALTPKLRFALAMLLSWPVGFLYLDWAVENAINLLRYYRGGDPVCIGWRTLGNGCAHASYSTWLAWFELLLITGVMVGLGMLLALWVIRPFREMAHVVEQLGPNSLGLRLRARGPNDETRRLSDAIDKMLDRMAEGYEAQRRFAANASHELRTPLATQRALIEVSLGAALTPDQLDLVSRQLLATNERNERLVEGLLVLAETERGLMATGRQRLDLITAATIETYRAKAAEQGVEISCELSPVDVVGEQPLLERLSSNLVQNAIKYNGQGGSVRVDVSRDGVLAVSNTGPTVAAEQVAGLFEPFRRASGDRLEHAGGVGLGLTIARSIVAAHGGAITARANPGGGLTVEARLPVAS